jgi:uncharacterized protein YjiS (DUF1127 family)
MSKAMNEICADFELSLAGGAKSGSRTAGPGGVAGAVREGFNKVAETLYLWAERVQQRRHLTMLDARMLSDIGITSADADAESRKPFWRG